MFKSETPNTTEPEGLLISKLGIVKILFMFWMPVPLKVNVVVGEVINVPPIFTSPAIWWTKASVAKVVPEPIFNAPPIDKLDTAVTLTVPLVVKLPQMLLVAAWKVFVPLPLNNKFP